MPPYILYKFNKNITFCINGFVVRCKTGDASPLSSMHFNEGD